ncbi:MAG: hypothetical protein L0Z68_05350 [Gammaproteobacteria bacterium]|nr:hypothetical protein [Gammaproteobacteria bacterium]
MSLATKTHRKLYLTLAILIPLVVLGVAIFFSVKLRQGGEEFRLPYEIAVNVAASFVAVLISLFLFDKANAVETVRTIADAYLDPSLPLADTTRRVIREAISEIDFPSTVEVFRDSNHAYQALVDDIRDGQVIVINTIFVTDDPNGEYKADNDERRREWIAIIKARLQKTQQVGGGPLFSLSLLVAPENGADTFINGVGGEAAIRRNGGTVYRLKIQREDSKYMANFVLINKEAGTKYIVYLGWFSRGAYRTGYPSPCARVESEHFYKFIERSYFQALTSN